MLTLGQQLIGKNIMSLRIGRPIGIINDFIVNPNNLKIEGWHATDLGDKKHVVLLSQYIREIIPEGFVVDDHEALTHPDELVRLKDILSYKFYLIGKNVVSDHKRKLGKVADFALDRDTYLIHKLHVSQSIIKSFTGGALMIDRSQITEITDKKIVIREATAQDSAPMPAMA